MQWVTFFFIFLFACPGWAQEFSALGGWLRETGSSENTYLWQLEYKEGLGENIAFSFSYLNEGSLPGHHRDGHAIQLWARTAVLDRRLSLSAGIGPYFYYDTTPAPSGDANLNEHGWGAFASLAATWHTESRWLFQLRANMIETDSRIDTISAAFGIGYQLDSPQSSTRDIKETSPWGRTRPNEITVFIGETSVHNRGPAHSAASGLEYRRGLSRHLDWTVTWLYEGESDSSRRVGIASQIWAVRDFLEDRLSLGFGAGPYVAVERLRAPDNDEGGDLLAAGIATMTVCYRFNPEWGVRASWNRVITNYDRDSDVWLGGISYRF